MSLDFTKVTYVDGETVIGADNLNDMQDAILDLDENKVEKEQGKGLSANDFTDTDKQKVDDAYVVPEGGIPKSAMASAVQTSLGKADTALQEDDLEDLTDDVDNLKNVKAPVIIDTESGAVASFDDGADNMPIKKLVVNIEPVQSGTGDPSPENVRPITGWTGATVTRTGKNLLDPNIAVRANAIINNSGEWETSNGRSTTEGFVPVNHNTPYCFSGPLLSAGIYNVVVFYDKDKAFLSRFVQTPANTNAIFTTPPNCCFIRYTFYASANLALCQLEKGSAPTDFVPYQGNTIPITFPSPDPGTVYGGTLDVKSGVLTVSYAFAELTGNDISDVSTSSAGYQVAVFNNDTAPGDVIGDISGVCNMYQFISGSGPLGVRLLRNTVYVYDSRLTDLATAKAIFDASHLQIVYKLANTTTYQLTAQQITTLLGANNIWADCGPVDVEYPADTKLYIQKINAPTDDDMIADARIESGKYFLIGNTLYLSTTVIPAGDTIIPGTNCTKTNLAEALNALNT